MPFLPPQGREEIEHLLIGTPMATLRNNPLRVSKTLGCYDRLEDVIMAYPHVGGIDDELLSQLNRLATIDAVPNVSFVCENVVDRQHRPVASSGIADFRSIELCGDLRPALLPNDERFEDASDDCYF